MCTCLAKLLPTPLPPSQHPLRHASKLFLLITYPFQIITTAIALRRAINKSIEHHISRRLKACQGS
jgi:hypothetical protein